MSFISITLNLQHPVPLWEHTPREWPLQKCLQLPGPVFSQHSQSLACHLIPILVGFMNEPFHWWSRPDTPPSVIKSISGGVHRGARHLVQPSFTFHKVILMHPHHMSKPHSTTFHPRNHSISMLLHPYQYSHIMFSIPSCNNSSFSCAYHFL